MYTFIKINVGSGGLFAPIFLRVAIRFVAFAGCKKDNRVDPYCFSAKDSTLRYNKEDFV